MKDPTEGLEMIPVNTDKLFTADYVRTLANSEADSLKAAKGYDIHVSPAEEGRRFCITLKRNDRTADLWIEVATNLGDNKGEVKRELSLIKNTKLAAIKTPISESELIQELLQPVIEATEP